MIVLDNIKLESLYELIRKSCAQLLETTLYHNLDSKKTALSILSKESNEIIYKAFQKIQESKQYKIIGYETIKDCIIDKKINNERYNDLTYDRMLRFANLIEDKRILKKITKYKDYIYKHVNKPKTSNVLPIVLRLFNKKECDIFANEWYDIRLEFCALIMSFVVTMYNEILKEAKRRIYNDNPDITDVRIFTPSVSSFFLLDFGASNKEKDAIEITRRLLRQVEHINHEYTYKDICDQIHDHFYYFIKYIECIKEKSKNKIIYIISVFYKYINFSFSINTLTDAYLHCAFYEVTYKDGAKKCFTIENSPANIENINSLLPFNEPEIPARICSNTNSALVWSDISSKFYHRIINTPIDVMDMINSRKFMMDIIRNYFFPNANDDYMDTLKPITDKYPELYPDEEIMRPIKEVLDKKKSFKDLDYPFKSYTEYLMTFTSFMKAVEKSYDIDKLMRNMISSLLTIDHEVIDIELNKILDDIIQKSKFLQKMIYLMKKLTKHTGSIDVKFKVVSYNKHGIGPIIFKMVKDEDWHIGSLISNIKSFAPKALDMRKKRIKYRTFINEYIDYFNHYKTSKTRDLDLLECFFRPLDSDSDSFYPSIPLHAPKNIGFMYKITDENGKDISNLETDAIFSFVKNILHIHKIFNINNINLNRFFTNDMVMEYIARHIHIIRALDKDLTDHVDDMYNSIRYNGDIDDMILKMKYYTNHEYVKSFNYEEVTLLDPEEVWRKIIKKE